MDNYKRIRKWKKIVDKENQIIDLDGSFILKLLCFNVLAQDLLDRHMFLYRNHDEQALKWKKRRQLLVQETLESKPHVICLQEIQEDHLQELLGPFERNGYSYIYKKRTHEKVDGLLLLYKKSLFSLLDYSRVEFYQSGIGLLNRDNVGLVAKFSLKHSPKTQFVVATTHLLYNPRRSDVRLAQVQLLFAEIERLAFEKYTSVGPKYLPIVLTGDFNFEPYTAVYNFIVRGRIEFAGKDTNLEPCDYNCLSNCLLPPQLYVTDSCQHFDVLLQRLKDKGNGKVMLEHTEYQYSHPGDNSSSTISIETSYIKKGTKAFQTIQVVNGHYVTFSSGRLTHPFPFQSVYSHLKRNMQNEATTRHDNWITTDYIFYSQMKLIEKFNLPSVEQCEKYFPTIPNLVVGSDHLCLGAIFLLKER